MLLLLISFIAGVLTILAPCVLPLLPVIIGGSVSSKVKDKARPYIIAGSLAGSIIVFTLLLKVSTLLINLSPNALDYVSGGLIVGLGLVAIAPEWWEKLMIYWNWQATSQRFLGKGENNKGRFIGPILIGIALGPVFASCSPTYAFILASVLPHSFLSGLIYLITYSVGLVLALLVISLVGKKFISRFSWAIDTHSLFRRIIGAIFVLIGILIITGQEVKVEVWVGNHLSFNEARVEQVLLEKQNKESIIHKVSTSISDNNVLNVASTPAPAFVGLTNWINSPPLTIAGLKGKVVLVDFWTYSCINCIRSIPYVEKWYQTYSDKGFVVVGVSTPEFAFEHNPNNVASAVIRDGITYPVALDNNYQTWDAFDNDSWPADYLIDKQGNIRYVSLGEGNYQTTEKAIQILLGINQPLKTPTSVVPISQSQTPETYFGTNRASDYTGTPSESDGTSTYTAANELSLNSWTLNGSWDVSPEYITSESSDSKLTFNVSAKNVYMVAGSSNNQSETVLVDLPSSNANEYGTDDPNGSVVITGSRLYNIVSLSQFGSTTVTITVPTGVSLYTFTFGS
jgi:cytochrome c biogenesis protein CcdA/thiol-disulfide isomerase/thioredoxin